MDTKLCRICGKLSENYVHIFKTEGLKNKIETCLPIIVSPHCLLPDTICSECLENVDNFYSFIKNCLQNIIVLEAQYDIMESCLKTKRKHEKGCVADFGSQRFDKNIQTDEDFTSRKQAIHLEHLNYLQMEKLSAALLNADNILNGRESDVVTPIKRESQITLVNYDESGAESENEIDSTGKVIIMPKEKKLKKYFDDPENDLINEIAQRKDLKRKSDTILPHRTKIFKMDPSNRRKNRQPKKVYSNKPPETGPNLTFNNLEKIYENEKNLNPLEEERREECNEEDKFIPPPQVEKDLTGSLPQLCLLCDVQFSGATALAAHVYEMHGIDMAQILSSEPVLERKKKIPNLVKITDLKTKDGSKDQLFEEPPTLQPTFVCPVCPAVLTNRSDLFTHLKIKHSKHAILMCGLCLHIASSYTNLTSHLETCRAQHNISSKYICKICAYHDDNSKFMENHIAVHDFILAFCKKQAKMFDPCDYIEVNPNSENTNKSLTCTECNQSGFATFKDFSTHRRSQHQIFHCDLCNKFYGRNSHLWKHVNRLHKGHPSITCQLCYKTSASKYHLAQHFNKIHSAKPFKQKQAEVSEDVGENFMTQKFQGFDFQSVRQSFMRQELLEQERKFANVASDEANSDGDEPEFYNKDMKINIKQEVKTESNPHELEGSDLEVYQDDYEVSENKPHLNLMSETTKVKKEKPSISPPKEIDASSDLYTNIITNYTPPQNEGEYKCPKCFKGFHKKTLLKKHKKNCRPRLQKDLLTRCKTCSRIFKDRLSLTKHLINYHSEYTCEICGQKVQSKCEIVSHIRFSHPACHLFCHCGNILRSKVDLLEHKQDHRNSFVCQFCADMLPTKIKLKMHILSLHRKILSLSCGICLKLFETQHILRDHVRLVHKNELSPLTSCTVCGKNYGSKWKTYDHLNKSHGRIFKACKACLDVFDTEEELQMHFDNSHMSLQNKQAPNVNVVATVKYESDGEENEDKNSSSEFSNDAEAYLNYNAKVEPNLSEDEEVVLPSKLHEYADITGQENRISLLEKRLMGNRKSVEIDHSSTSLLTSKPKTNTHPVGGLNKKPKLDNSEVSFPKPPKDKKPSSTNVVKRDMDLELDPNPLQNSSKRTVYVNSNDPSVCEICLKTWPAKKHLWQHYIRCHKTVAATVCGICLKTNDNYKTLQSHLRETHPTLLHGQGFGSNFICRICGRYHNASSKLKLHMAIHENFDWSILDHVTSNRSNMEKASPNNGYMEEHDDSGFYLTNTNHANESINYESLIEQVECSSDSELDAENNESSGEEESDESVISISEENSLESQMLQNMLKEKFDGRHRRNRKSAQVEVKKEYSSSESEDSSDSNQSVSVKSSDDDESSQFSSSEGKQEQENCELAFVRKPEELDSAIRSISYEQVADITEQIEVDICDIQPQSLNQHEIQSAVDSIL